MAARKASRGRSAAREALGRLAGAILAGAGAVVKAAALPVVALAIYVAGVWCLWQYAVQGAVRPGDPVTVAADCSWLSPADVAELNAAVRLGPRASLYDRWICGSVAGGYVDNSWVERVASVRREFPDRLVVDLTIRRPVALVRSGGRLYLVDADCYRLPVKAQRSSGPDYPVVQGVRGAVPSVGARWEGRPVRDALLLVELLGEVLGSRGPAMALSSVAVVEERGSFDEMPQLVARTASGLVIDWGAWDEAGSYLVPSVAEKRRGLEQKLDQISDPGAVEAIMVRYPGCPTKPKDDLSGAGGAGGPAGRLAGN